MYEYKIVPAPVRAAKVKGLKTTADRFAHAMSEAINAQAEHGWLFQRTETMTCEERRGMGRLKTSSQTLMVFSRPLIEARGGYDDRATLRQAVRTEPRVEPRHEPRQTYYDDDIPDLPETPYDDAPFEDTSQEPNTYDSGDRASARRDFDAYDTYDNEDAHQPQPTHVQPAAPHPGPAHPGPAHPGPARQARQEPLFRSAPLTRPEPGGRAEPTLRPRQSRGDEADGQ